jgi:hypothetical protein
MDELTLRNTDRDDNSIIQRILADIECLIGMLSNENNSLNSINFSSEQQSSSTTITNVTITDDNYRIIEHLRNRINRLEHERNVLLTSYQLLIKLLK